MEILFTKSDTIGSELIRFGLDEPVSHTAMLLSNGKVLHATFVGIKEVSIEEFLKVNQIVFSVDMKASKDTEERIYDIFQRTLDKDTYDYSAFAYFTFRALMRKVLRIPLPKRNPFDSKANHLCTEVVCELLNIRQIDASIITPYKLHEYLISVINPTIIF